MQTIPYLAAQLPTQLQLRPAVPADAGFFGRLYASTRDDLLGIEAERGAIDALIAMQQQMQAAAYLSAWPQAEYAILEEVQGPLGRIVVDAGPDEIRLIDLSLLPGARNRGYGGALLQALQRMTERRGVPLALSVQTGNVGARRLYASLGFVHRSGDAMFEQLIWHAR